MMRGAEQLFGLELTDAHKQMALQNVNTNLERYETLRQIQVPPKYRARNTLSSSSARQEIQHHAAQVYFE